jgi:hypothetical protein
MRPLKISEYPPSSQFYPLLKRLPIILQIIIVVFVESQAAIYLYRNIIGPWRV